MEFAELQPDLQQWIRDAVKAGQQPSVMVEALLRAGYQPSISRAVKQCIADFGGSGDPDCRLPRAQADSGQRFRLFEPQTNNIPVDTQRVEVLLSLRSPNLILFGNLLSASECNALIELSRPQLKPSRVVNSDNGAFDLGEARTSYGACFQRAECPLIAAIENRIARLLGVSARRGEPLQILHYERGAQYRPHYDFFSPERAGHREVLSHGGQRVGTLIMYLNDVVAGGATVFPKLALEILPKKGCGLFFSYANERGELDYQTLHGGSPVGEGEKWIATKWLRQADYVTEED
ncbi:2OG-Fe(II) oxygenase [Microbulbifer bruguierae]|uniref:2OG-Fe(II) oxygenase n=1 Tax=Microbulbifer bruguierae TaxID=3029061 RepID=A0ABY8NEJ9_9GAMM|nr:2OG-Fe(II) oxygenase [Microbulbifer bruguierae]WGL16865.1 2OG-Fe(II) oxygenase [Microbulbifer bruguierae]